MAARVPQALHLRIARPVRDLERAVTMYSEGLALPILGAFVDHDGFDGVMLGVPGADYHFELTWCRAHPVYPAPTAEDLVVFYLPSRDDWQAACARALAAGFAPVPAYNPYWDAYGRTFEDEDGYRVVLQNAAWRAAVAHSRD